MRRSTLHLPFGLRRYEDLATEPIQRAAVLFRWLGLLAPGRPLPQEVTVVAAPLRKKKTRLGPSESKGKILSAITGTHAAAAAVAETITHRSPWLFFSTALHCPPPLSLEARV